MNYRTAIHSLPLTAFERSNLTDPRQRTRTKRSRIVAQARRRDRRRAREALAAFVRSRN